MAITCGNGIIINVPSSANWMLMRQRVRSWDYKWLGPNSVKRLVLE